MKLSVIGGGSWGTAISLILSDNGHNVNVWHYKEDFCEQINKDRLHPLIQSIEIPKNITFETLSI